MIDNIIAFNWGGLLVAIAVVFYAFILALIIICILRIARYFMTAGKEQKLMRMEFGRLAEEVHLLRRHLENSGKNDPQQQSG